MNDDNILQIIDNPSVKIQPRNQMNQQMSIIDILRQESNLMKENCEKESKF